MAPLAPPHPAGNHQPRARPEVLAFLRDVKDHPADDAPRLVLADWLEENDDQGSVRGEFLRAEVLAPRLSWSCWQRRHLEARARELLEQHGADWMGPLRANYAIWPTWERGLLRVHLMADRLGLLAGADPEADECFAWVDGLAVSPFPGPHSLSFVDRVLDLPLLPWLNHLQMTVEGPAAERLLGCPSLARLASLSLSGRVDERGMATLTRVACANRLTSLELAGAGLGCREVRLLAGAQGFPALSILRLARNSIADEGASALAEAPWLARVRNLNLNDNNVGPHGARALARSPFLDKLEALFLKNNPLDEASARTLVERFGDRVFLPYPFVHLQP